MLPIITVDGLSYTYPGRDTPALEDVTLSVGEGELLLIRGPSGCGKSTLALAMGGYLWQRHGGQSTGTVRVGGVSVADRPLYETAEHIAVVQQNPEAQFCTLTVEDEVAFGLENRRAPAEAIGERVGWALEQVGAGHLRRRELAKLSGGEQQKVAIAAMLAARPRVLILDEPTSSLDPSATRDILAVLERLRAESGLTTVVIEHKLRALRRLVPRVIEMAAGRIVGEVRGAPMVAPVQARIPSPPGEALVQLDGVSVTYGEGEPALHDVSATLNGGQLVALMGDNGSGKSTVLRAIMGLLRPSAGRIEVLGRDTRDAKVSDLASRAGMVFQNPDHQLLANTVWDEAILLAENLGLRDRVAPRAERLLRAAELGAVFNVHPFRLSYGQKRRLNLIAVSSHDPLLFLADEALIGQDPTNAERTMAYLRRMADGGACVLLALHDPAIARAHADRVLFLERGELVADGLPTEALDRIVARGYDAYRVDDDG